MRLAVRRCIAAATVLCWLFLMPASVSRPVAGARANPARAGAQVKAFSLQVARAGHSATLLAGGRILIAGGDAAGAALSSSEIIDPVTLQTSLLPFELLTARSAHAAAGVPTGRVFIGQGQSSAAIASAESFDSGAGFTALASSSTARSGHTATVLLDGRVLLLGGAGQSGEALASGELFDPRPESATEGRYDIAKGRFEPAGAVLLEPRTDHSATLLPDGSILVIGGRNQSGALASAEIVNPDTLTSRSVGSLRTGRFRHTATLRSTSEILVLGGVTDRNPVVPAERFNRFSEDFALDHTVLAPPRSHHSATVIPGGRVLVAGGRRASRELQSVDLTRAIDDFTPLAVEARYPPSGARDVPTNSIVSVRFSAPADARSVTADNVILSGPGGQRVPAIVSIGESGLYAFVVPLAPLANATMYTFSLDVVNLFGFTARDEFSFETIGPSVPPLDRTVATDITKSAEFIYTGPDARQTGVAPGAISAVRAAVVRGTVQGADGAPLSDVRISVVDQSQFGSTLTQADGSFDLVVNGGSVLVIQYARPGYMPVFRQVDVPWQDYVWAPDVVMTPYDPRVTEVQMGASAPAQVARARPVTDAHGTRTATLLFASGTEASVKLPDGSTAPLTTASVRLTEYTVGDKGPRAMPAPLPATSAYTYAVEYSVDEAVAAGATEVRFTRPVISYLENFLEFPTGEAVPLGYYDRVKHAWIASDDGRIITIVTISGGFAELDVDGSGAPATPERLAELGITDAERQTLAGLYAQGQSLWRMPIPHFSPWDANWPFGPPSDAEAPSEASPETRAEEEVDDSPCAPGSTIDCENGALGERIRLVGSRFGLSYRSTRQKGPVSVDRVAGRVIGSTVPPGLKRIELEVVIAGQRFVQQFAAVPNQSYEVNWDGRDPYGRLLQGTVAAYVRIGYVYDGVYRRASSGGQSFGQTSAVEITGSRTRQEITLTQVQTAAVGRWDAKSLGFGGWTLDIHHAYDPIAKALYLGTGERRSASGASGQSVTTVSGGGAADPTLGGPATGVSLNQTHSVRVLADGTVVLTATPYRPCCGTVLGVYKVTPAGTIQHVGDNLGYVAAIGPDGSIYTANAYLNKVQRILPDNSIIDVAGTGVRGFSGDGGPATAAQLSLPFGVAVAGDGTVYISDTLNRRIRRVSPGGTITTVAGTGAYGHGGDGGPGVNAILKNPSGLAIHNDGSLLIADLDNYRVRRLAPDGTITTFAGNGGSTAAGDGGPATAASLRPYDVAVDRAGNVYVADINASSVRMVSSDGRIRTFAGNGQSGFNGDGGPAGGTAVGGNGVAVAPDGSVLVVNTFGNRIRRVAPAMPGRSLNDVVIASPDGSELFVFDQFGRHLRTLDARTLGTRFTFTYGADGLLTQVADGDGNQVGIERVGGALSAFVTPGGQRTSVTLDDNGYLSQVTSPAGHKFVAGHSEDGLLLALTDPNGNRHEYTYTVDGRLDKDSNAAGGYSQLTRTNVADGWSVALTSALGRTRSYEVRKLANGDWRRVQVTPYGAQTSTTLTTGGASVASSPDGTTTRYALGGDPRWGMQTPFAKSFTQTMPSGLTFSMTASTTAILSTPSDPMTLRSETHAVTVNGKTHTTVYDAATRRSTTTTPLKRQFLTVRDAAGRVIERGRSGLDSVFLSYDDKGRLSTLTQSSRQFVIGYDDRNRPVRLVDPLNRVVLLEYDTAGRLVRETRPDETAVTFAYDANGNLTAITPPERPSHRFSLTPADLLQTYEPPQVGALASDTTYSYNFDGQVTGERQAGGPSIAAGHDAAGRLSTLTYSRGQIVYAYHPGTGQLASAAGPDGAVSFTFDGPLSTGVTWSGPVTGAVTRAYNTDLRPTSEKVNGGSEATFTYDSDGLLTRAGAVTFTRHPQHGLVTAASSGSVNDTWTYSTVGEASQHRVTGAGGTELFNVLFTRDALGRIIQKTETIDTIQRVFGYQYDVAGRLSAVTLNGLVPIVTYSYDANGNRLSSTSATGIVTGSYDAQDRVIQYNGETYTYGPNGEISSRTGPLGTTHYSYDEFGNLITVILPDGTQIQYLVDPLQRRIGKKVNGVLVKRWVYGSYLRPVAELDGSGAVIARFVYGESSIPEYMTKNGQTYRFVKDHLGSPRIVVNIIGGAVVQRLDYDASGVVTQDSNPGFQPFGFAGGLYDVDTGLVRFGARDYDAATGRWTSKDPIRFNAGNPNLYQYAAGDPINFVDPDGRQHTLVLTRALAPAGAAAVADGPLPIGDAIALGILAAAVGIDIIRAIRNSNEAEADAEQECPVALPDGPLGPDNLPKEEGWEWRGPRDKGAAHNPKTGESLRPDEPHGKFGRHYDYKDPAGKGWRVNPETGRMTPKR